MVSVASLIPTMAMSGRGRFGGRNAATTAFASSRVIGGGAARAPSPGRERIHPRLANAAARHMTGVNRKSRLLTCSGTQAVHLMKREICQLEHRRHIGGFVNGANCA